MTLVNVTRGTPKPNERILVGILILGGLLNLDMVMLWYRTCKCRCENIRWAGLALVTFRLLSRITLLDGKRMVHQMRYCAAILCDRKHFWNGLGDNVADSMPLTSGKDVKSPFPSFAPNCPTPLRNTRIYNSDKDYKELFPLLWSASWSNSHDREGSGPRWDRLASFQSLDTTSDSDWTVIRRQEQQLGTYLPAIVFIAWTNVCIQNNSKNLRM